MTRHDASHRLADTRPSWEQIARDDAHRPWPSPTRPWIMSQTWSNLLFAHWPVSHDALRAHIPPGLALDSWEGNAWVGIVPFHLGTLAPRIAPSGWGLSFAELNVRTYVTAGGKPGVWFFSLDATNILAVLGARATYHLPYFWAKMAIHHEGDWIRYSSRRRHPGAPEAEFVGRYRPTAPVVLGQPGSIEHWLTERYCLYSTDRQGKLYRGEILHPPWLLQPAEVDIALNTMARPLGIELPGAPLLHFSRRLDMKAWQPERLD